MNRNETIIKKSNTKYQPKIIMNFSFLKLKIILYYRLMLNSLIIIMMNFSISIDLLNSQKAFSLSTIKHKYKNESLLCKNMQLQKHVSVASHSRYIGGLIQGDIATGTRSDRMHRRNVSAITNDSVLRY